MMSDTIPPLTVDERAIAQERAAKAYARDGEADRILENEVIRAAHLTRAKEEIAAPFPVPAPASVMLLVPSGWITVKLSREPGEFDLDGICHAIRTAWGHE